MRLCLIFLTLLTSCSFTKEPICSIKVKTVHDSFYTGAETCIEAKTKYIFYYIDCDTGEIL